jgi:hypothetical protein
MKINHEFVEVMAVGKNGYGTLFQVAPEGFKA